MNLPSYGYGGNGENYNNIPVWGFGGIESEDIDPCFIISIINKELCGITINLD